MAKRIPVYRNPREGRKEGGREGHLGLIFHRMEDKRQLTLRSLQLIGFGCETSLIAGTQELRKAACKDSCVQKTCRVFISISSGIHNRK